MTVEQLYVTLSDELKRLIKEYHLDTSEIKINLVTLSPEEAIGNTERKDYPILDGKEVMLQAEYKGAIGQAFTSTPATLNGSLQEILDSDIINDSYACALFIASLNSVMCYLGLAENTIHCKNDGPELCAKEFVRVIKEKYGTPKITLVGYQPALFENFSKEFQLRVLDLNPDNIGETRFGVKVEDGVKDYEDAVLRWAELVVCTGSTIANGSLVKYIDIGKEVLFFGTTLAGAAPILGLKRACFNGIND